MTYLYRAVRGFRIRLHARMYRHAVNKAVEVNGLAARYDKLGFHAEASSLTRTSQRWYGIARDLDRRR